MKRIPSEWITTEAMALARHMVKDELKARGFKPSLVEAKAITNAAKHLLAARPSIRRRAARLLKRRYE